MKNPAKIALVTGGAKRIGRAISLALAGMGYDVAIHCNRSGRDADETAALVREKGVRAQVFQADFSDPENAAALLRDVAETFGMPSCLVNNASVFEYDTPSDFTAGSLKTHFSVNLASPVLLAGTFAKMTGKENKAVIVNLLDQKLSNPNPSFFSYTLSKAALETATSLMAREYAPNIRVVAVSPGITLANDYQNEKEFEIASRMTPLGSAVPPEDVAQAVCYLVGAQSVTGTVITVDCGEHLIPLPEDVTTLIKKHLP